MSTFRKPCGCVIRFESTNVETVMRMCDCCAKDFNERHEASAAERKAERDRINATTVPA